MSDFATSETTAKLDAALAKAQSKIEVATATKPNEAYKRGGKASKYAGLEDIWNAARPALAEQGITLTQWPIHSEDNRLHLVTRIAKDGEWIRCEFSMPLAKQDPQGYGSGITYSRRYCLAAALGIVVDEDDDGNAASNVRLPTKGVPLVDQLNEKAQPDLGSIQGDGASRHASNPLFGHLQAEMGTKDNLDDLNLWWVQSRPAVERMNSEHQKLMFVEMMKCGFGLAPGRPDLKHFLISHKTEMKSLEDRSKNKWEELNDFYDLARNRLPEGVGL